MSFICHYSCKIDVANSTWGQVMKNTDNRIIRSWNCPFQNGTFRNACHQAFWCGKLHSMFIISSNSPYKEPSFHSCLISKIPLWSKYVEGPPFYYKYQLGILGIQNNHFQLTAPHTWDLQYCTAIAAMYLLRYVACPLLIRITQT